MTRKREVGYCLVATPQSVYHLARDQYTPVRMAWLKGAPYVDATGLHGDRLTLRMNDVEAIVDLPPEAVMSAINEKRADDADDSLETA